MQCSHLTSQEGEVRPNIKLLSRVETLKATLHIWPSKSLGVFVSRVSFRYCLMNVFVFAVFPEAVNLLCELPIIIWLLFALLIFTVMVEKECVI